MGRFREALLAANSSANGGSRKLGPAQLEALADRMAASYSRSNAKDDPVRASSLSLPLFATQHSMRGLKKGKGVEENSMQGKGRAIHWLCKLPHTIPAVAWQCLRLCVTRVSVVAQLGAMADSGTDLTDLSVLRKLMKTDPGGHPYNAPFGKRPAEWWAVPKEVTKPPTPQPQQPPGVSLFSPSLSCVHTQSVCYRLRAVICGCFAEIDGVARCLQLKGVFGAIVGRAASTTKAHFAGGPPSPQSTGRVAPLSPLNQKQLQQIRLCNKGLVAPPGSPASPPHISLFCSDNCKQQ